MKKIMFSDKYGLTQAVLDGRKTMTRRVIKGERFIARHWNPKFNVQHCYYKDGRGMCQLIDEATNKVIKPQYKVGEVVAIAQRYKDIADGTLWDDCREFEGVEPTKLAGWNNKLFVRPDYMKRYIRITNVKIEHLQDISDEDCLREGIVKRFDCDGTPYYKLIPDDDGVIVYRTPRKAFAALIDKVSGKVFFQYNPYVFVYEFNLIK